MSSLRKVRMGMIGGGRGAFIGAVHRIAAAIDQQVELVCGAFSSDPERSKASGEDFFLPADRCYGSYEEMIQKENALPEDQRMDFVAIVTPNHVHFPAAKSALEAGFHVLSDKPATLTLEEAKDLAKVVESTGQVYGLTHNYNGYPMIKQAKHMVASGELGEIRKIVVEYPQGWLATKVEDDSSQKQAAWRTDPARCGAAGCIGDIGTHAENIAEYVSGLEIKELAADLTTFVEGRMLDDDGNILLRFKNGAKGVLHASQICVGQENDLSLRIWGEKGGLQWKQSDCNTLLVSRLEGPAQIYRTAGGDYLCEASQAAARNPAGHPEAYLEGFANVYLAFATHLQDRITGNEKESYDYPTIHDGVRGMAFIYAAVASSSNNAAWTGLDC